MSAAGPVTISAHAVRRYQERIAPLPFPAAQQAIRRGLTQVVAWRLQPAREGLRQAQEIVEHAERATFRAPTPDEDRWAGVRNYLISERQLPVALVDDRPITCRVHVSNELAKEAQLELRHHQWLKRILEDLLSASDRASLLDEVYASVQG